MRIVVTLTGLVITALCLASPVHAQDEDRSVPNGGIFVTGWQGRIDRPQGTQIRTLADSRLSNDGDILHIETGPAATYWNPANQATGDFTVRATFREPRFMEFSSHPHSYGLFIGGSNMGTDRMRLVYCVVYGDGAVLVRGFGPQVFSAFGPTGHAAIRKATAVGETVVNEIAWVVSGNRAECRVNGTTVAAFDRTQLIGADKLASFDGVYGLRATHNVEAFVSGLTLERR